MGSEAERAAVGLPRVRRMELGRVGIWQYQLDLVPSAQSREFAAEIESLGYGTIWLPEAVGREAFVSSTLLLSGTERIVVATGIASIWARDALCANSALQTVSEAFPDRFLLGLGVSHQVMVEGVRGHDYTKPYSTMKAYLDGMDAGMFMAAAPTAPARRVLAALGPKMLRLAAERTDGAHRPEVVALVARPPAALLLRQHLHLLLDRGELGLEALLAARRPRDQNERLADRGLDLH